MDKGWNPLPVDFFSHTGALAHGIVPIGEVYPSHAVLWFSRAREEEEEENRMESAAVLIRSPCDVFIACLGCRQGQVTIGLVLVNGGGCTSGGGWHSCGDFFLSFCWGWGEERRRGVQDHTLVPATPEPTPRACRYMEHVHRHELQWPGPRDK